MDSILNQALFSGVVATTFMTIVMYILSLLGMPEVHPPIMLSDIMSISIVLSWMLHFCVGILFALFYMFVFKKMVVKIKSRFYKGALYGITLFLVAQIAINVLGAIFKNVSVKCDFPDGGSVFADHVAAMLKNGCNVVKQGGIKTVLMAITACFIGHISYGVAIVYTILKPKEK
jgi:hypothetical protein